MADLAPPQEAAKRIVVTGVNGFVGKHVARELASNDISVVGVSSQDTAHSTIAGLLESYHGTDLTRGWPEITGRVDAIIHLAGLAEVGRSHDEPELYMNVNTSMVAHMGDHYRQLPANEQPRLVVVSSSLVYDNDQPMPLTEDSATAETSPYAASKLAVEALCHEYRQAGMDCVIARPFNHTGPGQGKGFFVGDKIKQALAALMSGENISFENLGAQRDFTDVRDVARAYRLLATAILNFAIYNVCSGKSTIIKDVFAEIARATGLPESQYEITNSEAEAELRGSAERLFYDTGWKPTIPFHQTIADAVAELTETP